MVHPREQEIKRRGQENSVDQQGAVKHKWEIHRSRIQATWKKYRDFVKSKVHLEFSLAKERGLRPGRKQMSPHS